MAELGRKQILRECTKQVKLAGPLFLVASSQFGLQVISVIMVGHHGELALSGASLATSLAAVFGYILLVSSLFLYIDFCFSYYEYSVVDPEVQFRGVS